MPLNNTVLRYPVGNSVIDCPTNKSIEIEDLDDVLKLAEKLNIQIEKPGGERAL